MNEIKNSEEDKLIALKRVADDTPPSCQNGNN